MHVLPENIGGSDKDARCHHELRNIKNPIDRSIEKVSTDDRIAVHNNEEKDD